MALINKKELVKIGNSFYFNAPTVLVKSGVLKENTKYDLNPKESKE